MSAKGQRVHLWKAVVHCHPLIYSLIGRYCGVPPGPDTALRLVNATGPCPVEKGEDSK